MYGVIERWKWGLEPESRDECAYVCRERKIEREREGERAKIDVCMFVKVKRESPDKCTLVGNVTWGRAHVHGFNQLLHSVVSCSKISAINGI